MCLDSRRDYSTDGLINAVLLAFANDASAAIAEKIAGSESKFAKLMTCKARLWGAKNICKTASGLTVRGQKSTAGELACIGRQAMKKPDFANRMKTDTCRSVYQRKPGHNSSCYGE